MVREQHALKGGEVVEELLRRQALDLRVIDQRPERLLLQRRHSGIQLVSSGVVRASRGHGSMPSGPVSATSLTVGTARHTSTNVSLEARW